MNVQLGQAVLLESDFTLTPGKGTVVAQIDLGDLDLQTDQAQQIMREIRMF